MDVEKFQTNPVGHLISVGKGEMGYKAFVPAPLPPNYIPSSEVTYELSEAVGSIGELSGLSSMLPNPTLLIRPFIRREAVLSSKIEGTRTRIEDLYRYEIGQAPRANIIGEPPIDDVVEVYNYVRALEYGVERLQNFPVSLRFIRELHKILMEGVRGEYATPGEFRRSQNWIGRAGSTLNDATYVPPPVEQMVSALNQFEDYIHTEERIPYLIRLAFIHYQFEAIHPFLDGNGRVGRLLIALLLVSWEVLPAPLLYLSAYLEKHRDKYYEHLLTVSHYGAWDAWINFFLRGVKEEAQDGIKRAREIQSLQSKWQGKLAQERMSALTVKICTYLLEQPIVTAVAVGNYCNIPQQSALRILKRLAEIGIVSIINSSERNQQFVATELMAILTR